MKALNQTKRSGTEDGCPVLRLMLQKFPITLSSQLRIMDLFEHSLCSAASFRHQHDFAKESATSGLTHRKYTNTHFPEHDIATLGFLHAFHIPEEKSVKMIDM